MQIAQTAACNRLHNIEQRFARWLLITQDRVDSPTFAITHDFLATMLGTDRPTVSLAAGMLQKKGVIEWTRGEVQILSRAKLEKCACECYGATREDRYGDGPLRQGKAFKPTPARAPECCREDGNRQGPCVDSRQRIPRNSPSPGISYPRDTNPPFTNPSELIELPVLRMEVWCLLWSPREMKNCRSRPQTNTPVSVRWPTDGNLPKAIMRVLVQCEMK